MLGSNDSTQIFLQVILSVAEHHSNLIPWQLIAKRTGAVLKFLPLTRDQELDMKVRQRQLSTGTLLAIATLTYLRVF